MMMPVINKIDAKGSLDAWSMAAEKQGVHNFRNIISSKISKNEGIKWMEALDLPMWKSLYVRGDEFLANHQKIFANLHSPLYFIRIMPKTGHKRFSWINYTPKEILKNIKDHNINLKEYDISLMKSAPLDYSGNIITNDSGTVVELVEKEHTRLVYGTHTPLIVARKVYDTSFKYQNVTNASDAQMMFYKEIILKALNHTQIDKDCQIPDYFPGYYEFGVVIKNDIITIVFFEYQNGQFHTTLP